MSELNIQLLGGKNCEVRLNHSTSIISTSAPKEFQGSGDEFSSTDLLAAALGTCIATSIEVILKRCNIDPRNVKIIVIKDLSTKPISINFIKLKIIINAVIANHVHNKILKVAKTCLVHKNLKIEPEIKIESKSYR